MKILELIILSLIITASSFPQILLLDENFDYQLGVLTSVSSNWSEQPSGSTDIEVILGNLSFPNYSSSDVGNKIALDGGASSRSGVVCPFTAQANDGTTVYFSFLLNVTGTTDMDLNTSNGDYFGNFQNSALSVIRASIYVKQGIDDTKYEIGLAKSSSSSLTWYSTELDVVSTYLIVVAYSFISGTNNDLVKLWVNPDLMGIEPPADISINSGANAEDISYIQFRQNPSSGDMEIDGIRVADSWSLAPLPVELSSFSARATNEGIQLKWRTETEIRNFGFEIERLQDYNNSRLKNWEKIGFVAGNGNSNSPKTYSFIDNNVSTGTYSYRLKQIDTDGEFEYSKTIKVNFGIPEKFELSQNYPNPFNPDTKIEYKITNAGFVSLKVYEILGRVAAILVNEVKQPGNYEVQFDGDKFPSGIYFYRLNAGNYSEIKKMVLMR
jgi:Secretion system C-terminal sorting domain